MDAQRHELLQHSSITTPSLPSNTNLSSYLSIKSNLSAQQTFNQTFKMLFSTSTVAVAALSALSLAAAQPAVPRDAPEAYVTIETNAGNAFGDVCQKTVRVPIGSVYTNVEDLAKVSTLRLKGAGGVDANTVTCTPYKNNDGTGSGGLPFTKETPSYLSTNTVVVGSIVCKTE